MGAGGAFLIDHFDRPAPSEPPFAIPDPPGVVPKLILLNPLQIPLWVPALFAPRLRAWAPFPWWLFETWVELDREAGRERRARLEESRTGYDWRPLVVFLAGGLFLTLMEYFGHAPTLHELVSEHAAPGNLAAALQSSPFYHGGPNRGLGSGLLEFAYWSGWRLLGFFLLPALTLRLLGERVADHGLQTRGFLGHAWIYVMFLVPVLGLVAAVSYDEHFQTYYPFYRAASRSWYDFWAWEAVYAVQFFSLEFFFRGYWVKAGKTMMGSHAIYAMVVPYVMIHFGKPFLETIGAIFAGIILGTLALRTRSIWAGFLIHVSVAISMDLAALSQTTGLPSRWWPVL
jgi:membrane protease YdiL (CAAX protease family)